MRRIVQKDDVGCGIACVAMLSGQTYTSVRQLMFPDGKVSATSTAQIRSALADLGCDTGTGLVPLRGRNYRELTGDAVLNVWPRKNNRCWHWVVWDAARKRVLDPSVPPYKSIRAISYLTVATQ